MNAFELVQEAIATTLKVSPGSISKSTRDKDVPAWDSLGHLNLMMALEQTFDIMLDVEDFAKLTSVPEILAYLEKQGIS